MMGPKAPTTPAPYVIVSMRAHLRQKGQLRGSFGDEEGCGTRMTPSFVRFSAESLASILGLSREWRSSRSEVPSKPVRLSHVKQGRTRQTWNVLSEVFICQNSKTHGAMTAKEQLWID